MRRLPANLLPAAAAFGGPPSQPAFSVAVLFLITFFTGGHFGIRKPLLIVFLVMILFMTLDGPVFGTEPAFRGTR